VYLLHGAYGRSTDWIKNVPSIQNLANQHQLIIVCPDGSPDSWYVDSPVDSSFRFETHVSTEVPHYIDAHYKTIPDRKHRAIVGLSMGGFGAFFIAFRHSDTFGACGSMSGALDLTQIKKGPGVAMRLGDTLKNIKYYNDWRILSIIEKYPKNPLAITMDCGLQDFLYGMSKALHEKMVQLNISHEYTERPGQHDWFYWANSIKYQMLFFDDFFKQ
jgi:S-formylglutathione hydrolase FrmB